MKFKNIKRIIKWCWATLPRKILSCLVITSILLSSLWYLFRPSPAEAGLPVLWLKFDEGYGTTAYDFTDNNNDFTLSAESWTTDGKYGKAWNGDGAKWVSRADDADFDFAAADNFSISFWFKSDSATNPAANEFLIDKESASAGYAVYFDTDGDVIFGIDDDATWTPDDTAGDIGSDYYDNTWHHVTAMKEGTSNIRIYIDGILKNSDTSLAATGTLANAASLIIGDKDAVNNGDEFNGDIDEVKIYSYVRSDEQIKIDYNQGFAVKMGGDYKLPPGLVGHWDFDEGSGSTAYDRSGNANDGTLTGDTSYKTSADCKIGSCLSFNGSGDYVAMPTTDFGAPNTYTIVLWLKTTNPVATDRVFDRGSYFYPFRLSINDIAAPNLQYLLGFRTSVDFYYISTVRDIPYASWHQIAFTYISGDQQLYVNGISVANDTKTGTVSWSGAQSFALGSSYDGSANFWDGLIDNVMIYNRALSAEEISDLYSIGRDMNATVGHWKFDEGYGMTAYDESDRDNDLTLSAESWTTQGKFGRAWNGDGAKWLSRADDADFDFTAAENFSISGWVKSDSATNPGANEFIIDKESASAGYGVYFDTGGDLIFGIDDDATWTPDDTAGDIGSDYYDNTWHHFTAIKKGTTSIEIYIDGILKSTDSTIAATATLANSALLYIGDRDGVNNGDEFNGDIDEVKIYRYALTPEQVKIDYNQSKAVKMGSEDTLPSGLVGYWPMDEKSGSTAYDTSGNSNEGTLVGDTAWKGSADCKIGSCLSFDGTGDYVDCGAGDVTEGLGQITISVWMKATVADAPTHEKLVSKSGSYDLRRRSTEQFGMRIDIGLTYVDEVGDTAFTDTNWHHVVGVYNGVDIRLYVDGLDDSSTPAAQTGTTAVVSGNLFITTDNVLDDFPGQIDNVMIYNRALTEGEIAWLYNKGGPSGHWKFDEGEGTNAGDSSENNKPGTVTGGATWITAGKFNSGLDFAGDDDYVDVGDTTQTLVKAVSLWVKPDAINVTEYPLDLNGTGYVKITNGTVTGEGFTSPTIYINGKVGSTVTTGWNHILITTATGISASDLDIGRLNTTYFNGKIDEVKIFNYELNPEQVKIDYNQGAAIRFGE